MDWPWKIAVGRAVMPQSNNSKLMRAVRVRKMSGDKTTSTIVESDNFRSRGPSALTAEAIAGHIRPRPATYRSVSIGNALMLLSKTAPLFNGMLLVRLADVRQQSTNAAKVVAQPSVTKAMAVLLSWLQIMLLVWKVQPT